MCQWERQTDRQPEKARAHQREGGESFNKAKKIKEMWDDPCPWYAETRGRIDTSFRGCCVYIILLDVLYWFGCFFFAFYWRSGIHSTMRFSGSWTVIGIWIRWWLHLERKVREKEGKGGWKGKERGKERKSERTLNNWFTNKLTFTLFRPPIQNFAFLFSVFCIEYVFKKITKY